MTCGGGREEARASEQTGKEGGGDLSSDSSATRLWAQFYLDRPTLCNGAALPISGPQSAEL